MCVCVCVAGSVLVLGSVVSANYRTEISNIKCLFSTLHLYMFIYVIQVLYCW